LITSSTAPSKLSQFGSILTIVIAACAPARRSYSEEGSLPGLQLPATLPATHLHGNLENTPITLPRQAAETEKASGLCFP
jgi:hypothetical protein